MNPTFHCAFGQYISDFIQEKHTLGFPYIESGRILRCFDKFCTDNFPAEPTLSAEIGNAWAVIKPTEKSVSFQNRLGPVRELAKYMNRVGKTAYVIPPELSPKTDPPYQPHIFTEEELKAFFHEADSYPVNPRSRIRHLQIPVYFRLLFCCGLRPQEARLIKLENLSLRAKNLIIPESKGHRDRMVVIPEELVGILEKYYPFLKNEFPQSEYLFPCQRFGGAAYTASWVRKSFHECWGNCHFELVAGNSPRPYDFRHTRAIHLYRSGMPLSILSEFLGHCSEETTRIYAYADTEMKREAINKATADIAVPEEKPIWDETDEETFRKLAGLR